MHEFSYLVVMENWHPSRKVESGRCEWERERFGVWSINILKNLKWETALREIGLKYIFRIFLWKKNIINFLIAIKFSLKIMSKLS